jgi:hypothetical protein
MQAWARTRTALGYILTLGLMVGAVMAVQSQSIDIDDEPSAEGRLSQYYGTQASAMMYPGDGRPYPFYPGDWQPLYPGDEQWDGQYNYSGRYPSDIQSLATDGQYIYAGGENLPIYPYENPSFPLARWKGGQWGPFVDGTDGVLTGKIYTLAAENNELFAGGFLTQAGSVPVNRIAHWDGTQWDSMGEGISGALYGDPEVQAIAANGSDIYVGGWFNQAGGQAVHNIARWDGAKWYDTGGGTSSDVKAIAVSGSKIYVAGAFEKAGSLSVNHVAAWDGQNWSALGGGTSGTVNAIAIQGNNVYVGGQFYYAGGRIVNNIARWDGSQWYPLGSGLDSWDTVKTIKATPEGLYVGGYFSPVFGNYKAFSVALWNGSTWKNLGSGVQYGNVNSFEALDDQIFTGGMFNLAGNNWSNGFAIWNKKPSAIVYDTGSTSVAPGSTILIYGRFFPANQLVKFAVNGEVLSETVPSDADGKVYIRLTTNLDIPTTSAIEPGPTITAEPPIPARGINAVSGVYTYTLTANGVTASGTFTLQEGAALIESPWSGWDFTYPPYPILLPVIRR